MSRYGRWHMPVQIGAAVLKAFAALGVFAGAMLLAAYIFLSVKPFDASAFSPRIQSALAKSLPDGMSATIRRPQFQMHGPRLAVSSDLISVSLADGSEAVAENVDFVLSGLALLTGKVRLHEIAVQRLVLPESGENAPGLALPELAQAGFVEALMKPAQEGAIQLRNLVERLGLRNVTVGTVERGTQRVAEALELTSADGSVLLSVSASLAGGDETPTVPLNARVDDQTFALAFDFEDLAPVFPNRDDGRPPVLSVIGPAKGELTLSLAGEASTPAEGRLQISLPENILRIEDEPDKTIAARNLTLLLQPARDRVEIVPSDIAIGTLQAQLLGAVLLGGRNENVADAGTPLAELIFREAQVRVGDDLDREVPISARLELGYDPKEALLSLASVEMRAPSGRFFGSGSFAFTGLTPSIVFNGQFEQLEMDDLLALWPDYVAPGARRWAQSNLTGGLATDADISVAIPNNIVGRLRFGERIEPEHLNVEVTMRGTDIAGYQDIPTIRDVTAKIEHSGMSTSVAVREGLFWLQDGERIYVDGSQVGIADFTAEPLRIDINAGLVGEASAIAGIAAGKPIRAFEDQPLQPADFIGPVTASLNAALLIDGPDVTAASDWKADIAFQNVDIATEFDGYSVQDTRLQIALNAERAVIKGEALIDGQKAEVDLVEPFSDASASERRISMRLDEAARKALGVDLEGLLEGPVTADIELNADGTQNFVVDLTPAKLTIPGVGWTKGVGISGQATFRLDIDGGTQTVTGLTLRGGGLDARGSLTARGGTVQRARFTQFALNRGDQAALGIDLKGEEFIITLSGQQFDLRPVVDRAINTRDDGTDSGPGERIQIIGKLDRALGFKDEVLDNVAFGVRGTTTDIEWVEFDARTRSGQAIKAGLQPNAGSGDQLSLTTPDLGAFLRFTNLYGKVARGAATVELVRSSENTPYVGALRARKIEIVGEEKLSALVNTRADGQRSLNDSLRREISTERVEFDDLWSEIELGQGVLRLNRGTVRGPVVGSTFSGTVYDRNNNMDLRGVFIPAYGVNQLISALPIIGDIFGRTASGGFLGISWSLRGQFTSPRINVNPISLFTPGVFREIFNQS
ncbi:MAG: AsmA-like C-terminal region-containing protein [Pseudomonadota bacterium]